jgi:hypothetical protein
LKLNNVEESHYLGTRKMVNKTNAGIKAAISLIINEDLSALKSIFKNSTNTPSKTGLNTKKKARGKKTV